jgi:hypothetical protein
MTRITGTFHENQYTFFITSHSVLVRMKNVWDKSRRKNKNKRCVFNNFFIRKSYLFLFVWGPVSGCAAAYRIIVHTPCSHFHRQEAPRHNDPGDPSSERWNFVGRETSGNLAESSEFHATLGIFYMPQIYDMGQTTLLPLRRKSCWGFFALKIRRLRPGLNPRTWVQKASTQPLDHRSRLPFMR